MDTEKYLEHLDKVEVYVDKSEYKPENDKQYARNTYKNKCQVYSHNLLTH